MKTIFRPVINPAFHSYLRTNLAFAGYLIILLLSQSSFSQSFCLKDFYKYDPVLAHKTDSIFSSLNDRQRVAQMIISSVGELGKSDEYASNLIEREQPGGFILLKGTREDHMNRINRFNNEQDRCGGLKLLFSIDAEPSLFNGRIQGTAPMMETADIGNVKQSDSIAGIISEELIRMGIHQNYAPVIDLSQKNKAIKSRSLGSDPDRVIELAKAFVRASQDRDIVATIKHFPGHGLVSGDTHKNSVYIRGEMKEADNYIPLIDEVISVMVAHIIVRNNKEYDTNGLPASCSPVIINRLLKSEMGFKGIVVSDALNMNAVKDLDKPALLASKAGCDMLLIPEDESLAIDHILTEMNKDKAYRSQVFQSVRKIIRLKICLGLLN